MLAPFSFAVHDDNVFVYDLSTLSVKTYTKEGFQGKKDLGFVLYDYRWYERDGEFWMPVHNSDSLFVNISLKGDRFLESHAALVPIKNFNNERMLCSE